jgi:hypothetical protein
MGRGVMADDHSRISGFETNDIMILSQNKTQMVSFGVGAALKD